MQFFAPLVILVGLVSGVLADECTGPNARTQPPRGAIIVDVTGGHPGSFKTVAEGVAHLPNTTAEHTLFVFPGIYEEQVMVPKLNGPLVVQGYTCNTESYADNQDTLYANTGRQLYAKSYISGAVDFIFGQFSKVWFESCDFESVGNGAITANGNLNSSNMSEYVINKGRVFGSSNGTAYLGRPWHPYARVVFQNSELGDVVNPQGWQQWNGDNNTASVYFKEFNNRGPAAATDKRVSYSGQLDAPVTITEILGEDYKSQWFVDSKFV
ncbi:hypothetical protein PR002_g28837 [Phytophthora rubi]|uniref:Pectinesterase n=1 Tax=Phytophthora rubi TaxID=129364 RepID=A0A6A3H6K1_9STRA|nr:hypothetical protein PR002_g28837 [Phytophthora rubi]